MTSNLAGCCVARGWLAVECIRGAAGGARLFGEGDPARASKLVTTEMVESGGCRLHSSPLRLRFDGLSMQRRT